MTHALHSLFAVLFAVCCGSGLAAQCAANLAIGGSVPGLWGHVRAMHTWDPGGAGPAGPRTVFGGGFLSAGPIVAKNVAAYDEALDAWFVFGGDTDGPVRAFATLPTGELVAAGDFTTIGGVPANRIARWNGSVWVPLGIGTDAAVHSLLVLANGTLLVGGDFTQAGGQTANRLARWSLASGWAAGMSSAAVGFNGSVLALQQRGNGDIYAAGTFTSLSPGGGMNRIARWNGTAWTALSGFLLTGANAPVRALANLPNGDLVVGGDFTQLAGVSAQGVARWTGTNAFALGAGVGPLLSGSCRAFAVDASGALFAGGDFTSAGGQSVSYVARWNGSTWSPLGAGTSAPVDALAVTGAGTVLAGGNYTTSFSSSYWGVARWQQGAWGSLASNRGADNLVRTLAVLPNGDLVAGGQFTSLDGVAMPGFARRTATGWQSVGGLAGQVAAAVVMPNGALVVAGAVSVPNQSTGLCVVRWNGSVWTTLGFSNGPLTSLAVLADGSLVVGGYFSSIGGQPILNLARHDGSGWAPLAGGVVAGAVECLLPLANGTLAVGGTFQPSVGQPGSNLAIWDGSGWQSPGAAVNGSVYALAEHGNGDLVIGGAFTQVGALPCGLVARRSGGQWFAYGAQPSSSGHVRALWTSPRGDLYVGGGFTNLCGTPARHLARYDGTAWSEVLGGCDQQVEALVLQGTSLVVGGYLTAVGQGVARRIAWLSNSCAPSSLAVGSGCVGSNGLDTLAEATPAWLGRTFVTQGAGLPSFGLVIAVTGFAPTSLSIASILPEALPGCDLLVVPDLLGTLVLAGPTLTSAFDLPNQPNLIGAQLWHQLVSIGLDAQLQATEITATNALRATLGLY